VTLLLSLLEENDRSIRYLTAKLLTFLMSNKSDQVLNAILQSPVGVARLIDLLRTKIDMIRNGISLSEKTNQLHSEIEEIPSFVFICGLI
jgi:hypothetical protein